MTRKEIVALSIGVALLTAIFSALTANYAVTVREFGYIEFNLGKVIDCYVITMIAGAAIGLSIRRFFAPK